MRLILDVALMAHKTVDSHTGLLCDAENCFTNWEPVELDAGDLIALNDQDARFRVWCYRRQFEDSLAYAYSYDAESNWTTLDIDASMPAFGNDPWRAPYDCFVRVTVSVPSAGLSARTLGDIIEVDRNDLQACDRNPQFAGNLDGATGPQDGIPAYFQEEADRVCACVENMREQGDLVLIVLSDIHYSTGCIWDETARNVQHVAKRIKPDAIVQLGDVSDGIAPVAVTRSFVSRVLGDLKACDVPVYSCVGNHDANYFKGNSESLSVEECALLYLGRKEPWYAVDFDKSKTRCVFLQTFDPTRKVRYGFASQEVRWLKKTLRATPEGYKVIVFSHLPLFAEIHYWSDTLLNEKRIISVLRTFDQARGGGVLAYVHGHSHVDQIYRKLAFPDVSIGCAKFEDFEECKPAGSTTPHRAFGDVSQDLWDVVVVKPESDVIDFIRFGAGDDRHVVCHGNA